MDEPILQIEKITGIGQKNAACGVFVGRITLGDGTLGTLVSCILAEGADNDAGDLLRDIFELSTKKLENSQGGSLKAVKVAHDACRQYAQDNQKNLKVSFVLAFFYESACYIARHADKIKIFVFEPPKSIEIKFEEGSGPLKPGQIYLIATEKFLPIFDSSIFSDNQEVDLQEIIDGLATEISARDDQSEIGAAMVMVKNKGPQESDGTDESKEPQEIQEEIRETKGAGTVEEPDESEEPKAGVSPRPVESSSKLKNLLPMVLEAFFSEVKKLTRGDLGAILRLRKRMAIVAVVILFILAGSAIFTIRQKNEREKMSQVNDYLAQASAKYSEAEAIIELNKIRAREVLIDAQGNVKSAQAIDSDNERANKLASDISQKLKETEVQENISFQVLSELSQPVSSLSTRGKKIVGVGADRIVEVDPDSKSIDETEGLESAVSGFVYDNKAFVLADSKVHRVDLASSKIEKIIENGEGFDIVVFIGNVYLLGKDQVVKFSPIENGYAEGIDYLNEKTNFASWSRFAIDGNVWITNGSKILKLLRGENQNFEISGLSSIGELGIIYTNADLDTLYVIDRKNSALLVINKDGLYQKAYESQEFARASDLVVNDNESKVYLAVGDKILEAEL